MLGTKMLTTKIKVNFSIQQIVGTKNIWVQKVTIWAPKNVGPKNI